MIVVIDGVRMEESFAEAEDHGAGYSDAWGGPTEELLPSMRAWMLPEGALAAPAYITGSTITNPAHKDLLTGDRRFHANLPLQGSQPAEYRPLLPTLFEELRSQDPSIEADETGITGNADLLSGLEYSLYPGMGEATGGTFDVLRDDNDVIIQTDPPVTTEISRRLAEGHRLILANLHMVDAYGHLEPERYVEFVTAVDDPITQVWQRIKDSDARDSTLLVVLSDHGRHRFHSTESPWQHHGCPCSGCREVPILMLGPGIAKGIETTEPHIVEDVAQTIAWLMDFELPHGTGMVMTDMLTDDQEVPQRSGQVQVHASGELLASQRWTDSFSSRSEVVIGDDSFANDAALHVESPRVLQGQVGDFACWRELEVGTDEEKWFWSIDCRLRQDGDWEQLTDTPFSPTYFSQAAMVEDRAGRMIAAMADAEGHADVWGYQVRLATWEEVTGWSASDGPVDVHYQSHPSIALAEDDTVQVALTGCLSKNECRYARRVFVYEVSRHATGSDWTQLHETPTTDSQGRSYTRFEHPAMTTQGSTLHLAYQGMGPDGNALLTSSLTDGTWSSARAVDDSGQAYVHLPPAWSDDGTLYWARRDGEGFVELCKAAAGDTTADCTSTEHRAIDSITPADEGVWAAVSAGDGAWSIEQLAW